MYRQILFISFCFVLSALLQAQPSAKDFEKLLDDEILSCSDASVMVYDLDNDSLLFSHREHKLTRPASVLKIITSVAAVERLGADYELKTYLLHKGNNLYIKGCADPLFSYEDLREMLQDVPKGSVVDTLFADCSFMDSIYWGPGWSWDDTPYEFQPYISPLMLCGGCVDIKAKPAEKGMAPCVECYPPSSFYTIVNEAVSGCGTGERFTILRDWLDNTNVIRLRGDCTSAKSEKMNLFPSQDFFVTVASELLAEYEIKVHNTAFSAAPEDCDTLSVVSRPITDIVYEALMESNNLCAEALSYHLGALYGKYPVRQEQGPKIIKGFLNYSLDMPLIFDIRDGSGLSPYTLISADILLQTLKYIYKHPQLYDIIMKSLPQSGVSGTMKNRTKGTSAYRKVFAKTGTVTGVCTLVGYAKGVQGNRYTFVILNDGLPKARLAREWQDKVCEVICR